MIGRGISCVDFFGLVWFVCCAILFPSLFVFILLGKEEDLANFLVAISKCHRACNDNQIKTVA